MSKYPRLGGATRRYRKPNPPPCIVCGAPATVKRFIQVWHMRGDDEVAILCQAHNRNDQIDAIWSAMQAKATSPSKQTARNDTDAAQ